MDDKILKITITASNRTLLNQLMREFDLDIGCSGGIRGVDKGEVLVDAYVPPSILDKLERPGIKIKVFVDAVSRGIDRQKEVGNQNRFADSNKIPQGFGIKE